MDKTEADLTDPQRVRARQLKEEASLRTRLRDATREVGWSDAQIEEAFVALKPLAVAAEEQWVAAQVEMLAIARARLKDGRFTETTGIKIETKKGEPQPPPQISFPGEGQNVMRNFQFTLADAPTVFAALEGRAAAKLRFDTEFWERTRRR